MRFDATVLKQLFERLVNREDCYYSQQWGKGSYLLVPQPMTIELLEQHLAGRETIGLPLLSANSTCKYIAWDEDTEYERNHYTDAIQSKLTGLGYHLLREGRRPGRGGHLNLYLDSPVPAADCRLFAYEIGKLCNIPEDTYKAVDRKPAALELFPKQDRLESGGVGNCIKMPWGLNRKTEANKCRALFEDCPTMDIVEQMTWFLQQPLNPARRITEIADTIRRVTPAPEKKPRFRTVSGTPYAGNDGSALLFAEDVARALSLKQAREGWWNGNCPSHDDAHKSFGCKDGDRSLIVKCQAGCIREDLITKIKELILPAEAA